MKCPVCNANLVKTERHGIEIDYCLHYCGVWLDRGELDNIIKQLGLAQRQDDNDANGSLGKGRKSTGALFEFD